MIQELFGGGVSSGLLNRDRNIPISGVVFEPSPSASPSPSPSSSTTVTTATDATPQPNSTSENHKLRCPRCDSSNTKFCYYNNYNLTQPRHFCKTCRRYWTKGGALRNVPIGGGCRKNKGTTISAAVGRPISATGKLKAVVSSELSKSGFINTFEHEFDPNPNPNPILWSSHPPHTSHLLSLLRATQNPNPSLNFTPNPLHLMKDQSFSAGSNMGSLGFEQQHQQQQQQQALGQTSSLGLCSSLWRNNLDQVNNQVNNQGMMMMSSSGNEVQRLRSSSSSDHPANYYQITSPLMLGSINNVANTTSCSSTSASPTILDSAPVHLSSGEVGFWNQTLPWSDLAAANGSYP